MDPPSATEASADPPHSGAGRLSCGAARQRSSGWAPAAAGADKSLNMERAEAKKLAQELREKISRHDYLYYVLAKPEISTGRFIYSKPNNVLWTYDAPKRVTMLIAAGMLTTYYPDLKKAERIEVKRYQDRIFRYMGASGAIDELATQLKQLQSGAQ